MKQILSRKEVTFVSKYVANLKAINSLYSTKQNKKNRIDRNSFSDFTHQYAPQMKRHCKVCVRRTLKIIINYHNKCFLSPCGNSLAQRINILLLLNMLFGVMPIYFSLLQRLVLKPGGYIFFLTINTFKLLKTFILLSLLGDSLLRVISWY